MSEAHRDHIDCIKFWYKFNIFLYNWNVQFQEKKTKFVQTDFQFQIKNLNLNFKC